jgi:hypothetical protein
MLWEVYEHYRPVERREWVPCALEALARVKAATVLFVRRSLVRTCYLAGLEYHRFSVLWSFFRPTHHPSAPALACLLRASRVCTSAHPLAHQVSAQPGLHWANGSLPQVVDTAIVVFIDYLLLSPKLIEAQGTTA